MPTYDFENEKGEKIQQIFRMSEAPRVGESIEFNGERYTRIWSIGEPDVSHVPDRNRPFSSAHVCPNKARELGHKVFDSDGSPVFKNQKEAREFAKRSDGLYTYGEMPTRSERDRHIVATNKLARSLRPR